MSEWVTLKASDGQELSGYVARPEGKPLGSLIVVQEIFGVNPSIRSVADSYAREGFVAIAPALFDRFQKGVELGYSDEEMQQARTLMQKLNPDTALLDIAAAYQFLKGGEPDKSVSDRGVAVLGFCYGGFMSWLSATRGTSQKMQLDCCVGYYAGGIGKVAAEEPTCPVLLHFGADDTHIGQDQVEAVRNAHPEVDIFVYPGAGHGFANADRDGFVPEATGVAWERSLEFLKKHLG